MTNFTNAAIGKVLDITMLPRQLRGMIESELRPGERITWLGQPLPGLFARGAWPLLLFGIPWTAFAIFWTYGAAQGASGSADYFQIFPLFGAPFILIGFWMLSGPLRMRRNAGRSAYVLTDRRAILFNADWRDTVTIRSFEPERLGNLQRNQRADGSGDLIFVRDVGRDSDGDRTYRDVGFIAVADVKAVEERVRELVRSKASG